MEPLILIVIAAVCLYKGKSPAKEFHKIVAKDMTNRRNYLDNKLLSTQKEMEALGIKQITTWVD